MEDFPYLQDGQVVLLRGDRNTGHVIDEDLKLVISDLQKVFTVLNNVDEALQAAREIITSNNEVEIILYGKDQAVLYIIGVDNVDKI